jgi:hypothetical protein
MPAVCRRVLDAVVGVIDDVLRSPSDASRRRCSVVPAAELQLSWERGRRSHSASSPGRAAAPPQHGSGHAATASTKAPVAATATSTPAAAFPLLALDAVGAVEVLAAAGFVPVPAPHVTVDAAVVVGGAAAAGHHHHHHGHQPLTLQLGGNRADKWTTVPEGILAELAGCAALFRVSGDASLRCTTWRWSQSSPGCSSRDLVLVVCALRVACVTTRSTRVHKTGPTHTTPPRSRMLSPLYSQ